MNNMTETETIRDEIVKDADTKLKEQKKKC